MHVELMVLVLTSLLLTQPGGVWDVIFGENTDPAAGIILATVTAVALAVQLWLIYRTARRGEQTIEDSEAAVSIFLPVCLHGDPLFYHRNPSDDEPG